LKQDNSDQTDGKDQVDDEDDVFHMAAFPGLAFFPDYLWDATGRRKRVHYASAASLACLRNQWAFPRIDCGHWGHTFLFRPGKAIAIHATV
jgi:hypothetical protein